MGYVTHQKKSKELQNLYRLCLCHTFRETVILYLSVFCSQKNRHNSVGIKTMVRTNQLLPYILLLPLAVLKQILYSTF